MPYVQMPVPEERVQDVYRLLASSPVDPPDDDWDERLWTNPDAIREHLVPRSETIHKLALYLADRPGEHVSSEQAAEALGLRFGWNSLAGALGAFGNYASHNEVAFPWDTEVDPVDGRVRFKMDTDVATAIKSVL